MRVVRGAELNSAIGRSDGHYIQALYQLAQREPLNEDQEKGFEQDHLRFLKDIIHGTTTVDSSEVEETQRLSKL